MKNQIKVTNKMMLVNFEFPIAVGQVKLDAICQAMISKDRETGELIGDFELMDLDNITYMDMPVKGYDAWKKLREFHLEFGVNLQKLIDAEHGKIVTDDFQKEFLDKFNVRNFEI